MVYTSLDQTRLGQKEPLHALYAAKKLNDTDRQTDRPTDRQTDGHRHFKSSDGAKKILKDSADILTLFKILILTVILS